MLRDWTEIAPKALLAAIILWVCANYLIFAPEVATRVARADHLPACRATIEWAARSQAEQAIAGLPQPDTDISEDLAIGQLRRLQDGPFGTLLRDPSLGQMFGLGAVTDMAIADYEQKKRAATEAYDRGIEQIREATAAHVGGAEDLCACLADASLGDSRNEWTIYTATLGLIQPAPVRDFGKRILQQDPAGCGKAGA